jgi:hypothetical protein
LHFSEALPEGGPPSYRLIVRKIELAISPAERFDGVVIGNKILHGADILIWVINLVIRVPDAKIASPELVLVVWTGWQRS